MPLPVPDQTKRRFMSGLGSPAYTNAGTQGFVPGLGSSVQAPTQTSFQPTGPMFQTRTQGDPCARSPMGHIRDPEACADEQARREGERAALRDPYLQFEKTQAEQRRRDEQEQMIHGRVEQDEARRQARSRLASIPTNEQDVTIDPITGSVVVRSLPGPTSLPSPLSRVVSSGGGGGGTGETARGMPPQIGSPDPVNFSVTRQQTPQTSPFDIEGAIARIMRSMPQRSRLASADTEAAERAAFARAKDQIGDITRGSIEGLSDVLADRGIGGPLSGELLSPAVTGGQAALGEVVRSQAIERAARAEREAALEAQLEQAQRAGDINAMIEIIGMMQQEHARGQSGGGTTVQASGSVPFAALQQALQQVRV